MAKQYGNSRKKTIYFLIVFLLYIGIDLLLYGALTLLSAFIEIAPYTRLFLLLINFVISYYATYRIMLTKWMSRFVRQI